MSQYPLLFFALNALIDCLFPATEALEEKCFFHGQNCGMKHCSLNIHCTKTFRNIFVENNLSECIVGFLSIFLKLGFFSFMMHSGNFLINA